jgi:uncharacterized protein (UPF0332 family)
MATLAKAERSLKSALLLLENHDLEAAISRTYYACFYIAAGLLELQGLRFKSHRAVISSFHLNFIKPAVMNQQYSKLLTALFNERHIADYDQTSLVVEEVLAYIKETENFIEAARPFFRSV